VLTGSGNYTEGTHQVEVSFAAPLKCPPQYFQFCVPVCETLKCFGYRKLILVALTTFIAIACMNGIAALAGYLDGYTSGVIWWVFGRYLDYLFTPPMPATLGTIMNAALAVAIGMLIWWWLCIKFWNIHIGACCFVCCIFRIILWQVPLMVAICLLWFLPTSFLLSLVSALVLMLISYLFFLWWKAKCCVAKCDPLFYLIMAIIFAGAAIAVIDIANVSSVSVTAPNSFSAYVPWYVAMLWAITSVGRILLALVLAGFMLAWGLCLSSDE
jgi:hypothetical protein